MNLGDYSEEELIHIEYDPDANGSWDYKDTVRISGPVPINLTIDSNNNNVVDDSDDAIENHEPGWIILVDDDGDGNPLYHYEPAPMTLSFGQSIDWGEEFTWELKYPSHVRVYTDQNRTNVVPSGEKSSATPPEQFYVEGLTVGSASGDVIIQANVWRNDEYIIGRDVVRGTVLMLDLDLPVSQAGYHNVFVAALFPPFEPASILMGEEPQGVVNFDVDIQQQDFNHENYDNISTVSRQGCGFNFDTSTVAGTIYAVTAEFLGCKNSDTFPVIPGFLPMLIHLLYYRPLLRLMNLVLVLPRHESKTVLVISLNQGHPSAGLTPIHVQSLFLLVQRQMTRKLVLRRIEAITLMIRKQSS